MRARHILSEAITTQPRNLKHWLSQRVKLLDALIPAIEQAREVIKATPDDAHDLLRYALGSIAEGERASPPYPEEVDLVRLYQLEDLKQNCESIIQHGDQFFKYLSSTLGYIHPISPQTRFVLELLPRIEEGFADQGYLRGQHDDDPDYRAAQRLADAYTVIAQALVKIEALVARLGPMLADRNKRQAHTYDPDKYRPDHGEMETLYHASIHAADLVKNGFAAEKPSGRRGVGNYGDQAAISFTHSMPIAHDIVRYLRELWMIVHGELTERQILGWMQTEGIDPRKVWSIFGQRSATPLERTIILYRGYMGFSKIRTDPVFTSPEALIPDLRKVAYKDIGIIACPVRLDGGEQYFHGENEFRVRPSQVVGPITRVI